jgi:hypothetical protein
MRVTLFATWPRISGESDVESPKSDGSSLAKGILDSWKKTSRFFVTRENQTGGTKGETSGKIQERAETPGEKSC